MTEDEEIKAIIAEELSEDAAKAFEVMSRGLQKFADAIRQIDWETVDSEKIDRLIDDLNELKDETTGEIDDELEE